jgi:hypothetical protein
METGETLEINVTKMPKDLKEGDIFRQCTDGYIIDEEYTKQRKSELADRLNRLFEKHKMR